MITPTQNTPSATAMAQQSRATIREHIITQVIGQLPYDMSMPMDIVRSMVEAEVDSQLTAIMADGKAGAQAAGSVANEIAGRIRMAVKADKVTRQIAIERSSSKSSLSAIFTSDLKQKTKVKGGPLSEAEMAAIAEQLPALFDDPDALENMQFVEHDGVLFVRIILDEESNRYADIPVEEIRMLQVKTDLFGNMHLVELSSPTLDYGSATPRLRYSRRELNVSSESMAGWMADHPQEAAMFNQLADAQLQQFMLAHERLMEQLINRWGGFGYAHDTYRDLSSEAFLNLSGAARYPVAEASHTGWFRPGKTPEVSALEAELTH